MLLWKHIFLTWESGNLRITVEEIRQAVHMMKSGKATNLDGIPVELMKSGNDTFTSVYGFRSSKTANFPTDNLFILILLIQNYRLSMSRKPFTQCLLTSAN